MNAHLEQRYAKKRWKKERRPANRTACAEHRSLSRLRQPSQRFHHPYYIEFNYWLHACRQTYPGVRTFAPDVWRSQSYYCHDAIHSPLNALFTFNPPNPISRWIPRYTGISRNVASRGVRVTAQQHVAYVRARAWIDRRHPPVSGVPYSVSSMATYCIGLVRFRMIPACRLWLWPTLLSPSRHPTLAFSTMILPRLGADRYRGKSPELFHGSGRDGNSAQFEKATRAGLSIFPSVGWIYDCDRFGRRLCIW